MALEGAELWAVVKADAYGQHATDASAAALGAGASVLCVATVPEALVLRRALGDVRTVMGPATSREIADARDAGLELGSTARLPRECASISGLDTGMAKRLAELLLPAARSSGWMSHLASADTDAAFTEPRPSASPRPPNSCP